MASRTQLSPRDHERDVMSITGSIRPEDVMKQIDTVKDQLDDEPAPGILEMILNPDARARTREIEKVKTAAIAARRVAIEQMMRMIDAYVGAHAADIELRGRAWIQKTFHELEGPLRAAAEAAIVSFYETFVRNVAIVGTLPLSDEQKKEYATRSYKSLLSGADNTREGYERAVENVRRHFLEVVDTIRSSR